MTDLESPPTAGELSVFFPPLFPAHPQKHLCCLKRCYSLLGASGQRWTESVESHGQGLESKEGGPFPGSTDTSAPYLPRHGLPGGRQPADKQIGSTPGVPRGAGHPLASFLCLSPQTLDSERLLFTN